MLLVRSLPELIRRLPGLPQSLLKLVMELPGNYQKFMTSECFGVKILRALYLFLVTEETFPCIILLYVAFFDDEAASAVRTGCAGDTAPTA